MWEFALEEMRQEPAVHWGDSGRPGVECHTLRVALSLVRGADRSGRRASGVGGVQLPVKTEKKGIRI